jgi:capsular polysaccharide biosynthesis protein
VTFVDYMRALRKSWWLVLLLTIAGAGAIALPTSSTDESFRASVRFVVGPAESVQPGAVDDAVRNLTTNGSLLKTFALMLKSDDVVTKAANGAGIEPASRPAYDIEAFAVNETSVAQVEVSGPEAAQVAALADGIGRFGVSQFESLFHSFRAEPLDAAEPVSQRPQTLVYGVVGGAAGFAIGFLLAVARFAIAEAGGLDGDRRGAHQGRRRRRRSRKVDHVADRPLAEPTDAASPAPTEEPRVRDGRFGRAWQMAMSRRDVAPAVSWPSGEHIPTEHGLGADAVGRRESAVAEGDIDLRMRIRQ